MLVNLFSLAARPSRPRTCRKRRLCQGHARLGRFTGLDIRRLASGHKGMRATDVNTSGRGSEHEQPMQSREPKPLFSFSAVIPPPASSLSPFLSARFSGVAFLVAPCGPHAFPASSMRFSPLRMTFSSSTAFAFLRHAFFFPRACLFVRRHPGICAR